MGKLDAAERPALYFVAFDIEAKRFDGVRKNGGMVLAADSARELTETLDYLLSDKILIEAPAKK